MSTVISNSSGQIVSGSGYVPIDPTARQALIGQLAPGENLLWAGRPNLFGVSILAILLGMVLILGLIIGTRAQVVFFSAIMIPLGALSTFVRTGFFYGVTDRRLLWLSTRSVRKVLLDLPLCDALGHPVEIVRWPLGILAFGGPSAEALGHHNASDFAFFLGGPKASYVFQIAVATRGKLVDEAEQSVLAGFAAGPDERAKEP